MEPSSDNTQSDTDDDNDDAILKKGEFVVFRGTDGLPFKFLQQTKDSQQDSIIPETRNKENFLTSDDHENQECSIYE